MHRARHGDCRIGWRLVAIVVMALGLASAQHLDVSDAAFDGDVCDQSVLYPLASQRTGAVALMARFERQRPDVVRLTFALRYAQPLFGIEPFVKAEAPNVVAFVVETERAQARFGLPGALFTVEIVDLGYLRNTRTEFITVGIPVDVFHMLTSRPTATYGRIDTRRHVLEFEYPAPFFEALGRDFTSVCLRHPSTPSSASPTQDRDPWDDTVPFSSPSFTQLRVNIAVLRVRDRPGLEGSIVGRVEEGLLGQLVDVMHHDVDGYRWWHVRFLDGRQGWVADGDDDLDYIVRVGSRTRPTPFAPLPDLEPLATRLLAATNMTRVECSAWQRGHAQHTACGMLGRPVDGAWGAAADDVRLLVEPVLHEVGLSPLFPWADDGGRTMVSLHVVAADAAQVVVVVIGIGPDDAVPRMTVMQHYP